MLFSYSLFLITVMAELLFAIDMPPFGPCQTKSKKTKKKKKKGEEPLTLLTLQEMAAKPPRKLTFLKGMLYFVSVCQPEK